MTTGRDALHRIDASIAEARRIVSSSSADAASDARAMAATEKTQVDILNAIAGIRVDHLAQTDGVDRVTTNRLGNIDAKAERLIADHDAHIDDLNSALQSAEMGLRRLETDRRDAELAHSSAIEEHEKAVENTRDRLENDDLFQQNAAGLEEANAILARARQKFAIAQQDRETKGAAFESDRLFTYLRDRQFATSDYRAFFLFAALDRWVAGLVRYRDHKLNYDRLIEIPERIGEHVERLEEKATSLAEDLESYERTALEKDGVGKLRDKVSRLHEQIEVLDQQISDAEDRYQRLAAQLKDAVDGESGPLSDARALLTDAMSTLSIPDLKILAAETETLEDDRMVESLIRVRREKMELEESRRAVAGTLDRHARTLSELEDVRRRFKGARFDSPYSEFSGRNIVGTLLSEFLRGALSRDDLWRRIERGHRTRRRDWNNDMGGDPWRDGFGLPQDWGGSEWGGSWNGGKRSSSTKKPRRTRRPRRLPRTTRAPRAPRIRFPRGGRGGGGRRGGGGFKTGGGF